VLTLTQTHTPSWEEAMAGPNIRSVLHTYWSLAMANLADHLEGRPLNPMVDFTSPQMRAEVLIDAPRDAVYDSMLNPEKFRQWFGANIDVEPCVGGRWAMGGFELDPSPARFSNSNPARR
jgi:Activator of Hsp90 ATPase homolog 1-like protein